MTQPFARSLVSHEGFAGLPESYHPTTTSDEIFDRRPVRNNKVSAAVDEAVLFSPNSIARALLFEHPQARLGAEGSSACNYVSNSLVVSTDAV